MVQGYTKQNRGGKGRWYSTIDSGKRSLKKSLTVATMRRFL